MPFSINVTSHRSSIKSAFGCPQPLRYDLLPNNLEVGKYFQYKKAQMMAESKFNSGKRGILT